MTARQDPQPKYAGVCADCGGRAQTRTNWDVIAPAGRADAPSFHHRCSRCWVRRQLARVDGGKLVKLRRPATCASCSSSMARGEHARVFSRAGWTVRLKRRGRERVRVCLTCVRLWQGGQ